MDITLDFGLDTKLDAVNVVLDAIGSTGINSEEELDWNIDAADAEKTIDRYSQVIQTNRGKGWWFNKEKFHSFTPDPVNGYVVVPANTIVCLIKREQGKLLPVTLRGNKMFDTESYGYDMRNLTLRDGKIHCELVVLLNYTDLPTTAKQSIATASAYWFQTLKEGESAKMAKLEREAREAMIDLESEDARQRRRNMYDSSFTRSSLGLIGGLNNVG